MANSSGHNLINTTTPPSPGHQDGPDWILYTVPGIAFLLGICVFSVVYKTQRPQRQKVILHSDNTRKTEYRSNVSTADSWDTGVDHLKAKSLEALSYENLETAIYANKDTVTDNVIIEDEDYIVPDEEHSELQEGQREQHCVDTLSLRQNISDTDGDSYVNMECPLYERSSRQMLFSNTDEEDYINPDLENGDEQSDHNSCAVQDSWDTDGESYEDMDGPQRLYQEESDLYEKMEDLTPSNTELEF